jgi:putative ABC transport system permease protein
MQEVGTTMGTVLRDVHYAVRMLRRTPGFTALAVLTLALGIGANTAMFSVVKAILLEPLQYKDADRLIVLNHYYEQLNLRAGISAPGFVRYRQNSHSFEQMAARSLVPWDANLTGRGEPERLRGSLVTANFFETFGSAPVLGRGFMGDEDQPGNNQVVVLSYRLWQRRFAGEDVLNHPLTLNGKTYKIVGVLPETFRFGREFDSEFEIYSPIAFTPEQLDPQRWTNEFLEVYGRLKRGATLEQAQADVDLILKGFEQLFGRVAPFQLRLRNLRDNLIGDIRPALLMLLAAVGLVLLIACANVASLLLARAASRERETGIRSAVGGGRSRMLRQLLTENLVLALLGGAAGLVLTFWTMDGLVLLNRAGIPRASEIQIDRGVLLFAFLTSVVTGLVFGIVPSLRISKGAFQETLKETAPTVIGHSRFQSVLIVSQIAIALVLLLGAALMIESLRRVQSVSPGFDSKDLLVLQVALPSYRLGQAEQMRTFFDEVLMNIRALPGIQAADAVSHLPLGGRHDSGSFQIEGRGLAPQEPQQHGDRWRVTDDYFKTMRIPLRGGRSFTEQDRADSTPVVVIDETLARKHFPNEDPLGKHISFQVGYPSGTPRSVQYEIIGVVGHVKHWSIEQENPVQYYLSERQFPLSSMFLVIRTAGGPAPFAAQVRAAIRNVDPDLPIFTVTDMDSVVADSMVQRRLTTLLVSGFAAIALVLAVVGLYGLLSHAVALRTREIGIRMAVGAVKWKVVGMILQEGLSHLLIGVLIGLAGALAMTRLIANLLFGIAPTDPYTYAAVCLMLTACTIPALVIPARRATLIDPNSALRHE